MAEKFTYEIVKYFIEIESKSDCKLLSKKYKNVNELLEIQCSCGETFFTSFTKFKHRNKRQCNSCGAKIRVYKKKLNLEEIREIIESTGCILLSKEYIDYNFPLKIKCSCGNEFEGYIHDFKARNKIGCKECAIKNGGEKRKYKYEEVKQFIEIDSVSGCKLLSEEYLGVYNLLNLRCKCGNIFETTFQKFKDRNKRQCNSCGIEIRASMKRLSIEAVKNYIEVESGSEYKLLSDIYKNGNEQKLKICCNKGHMFKMSFQDFKRGNRCPKCRNNYKGEIAISKFLKENNINFIPQYRLKDCRNIRPLPFDFAIFDNKNNLYCLIEYQGEQHYKNVVYRGSKKHSNLEYVQNNDAIKKQYCKINNIKFIEIPYWDFLIIKDILSNELKILRR